MFDVMTSNEEHRLGGYETWMETELSEDLESAIQAASTQIFRPLPALR